MCGPPPMTSPCSRWNTPGGRRPSPVMPHTASTGSRNNSNRSSRQPPTTLCHRWEASELGRPTLTRLAFKRASSIGSCSAACTKQSKLLPLSVPCVPPTPSNNSSTLQHHPMTIAVPTAQIWSRLGRPRRRRLRRGLLPFRALHRRLPAVCRLGTEGRAQGPQNRALLGPNRPGGSVSHPQAAAHERSLVLAQSGDKFASTSWTVTHIRPIWR